MNIVIESRCKAELRRATAQQAAFQSENVRRGVKLRLEAVNHRIHILKVNAAVRVTESAGIARRVRIKRGLKFKIVKICVEHALFVVVVHLALAEDYPMYAQIEHARLLVRAFDRWQVRVTVLGYEQSRHGMIDDNILQIPLPLN